MIDERRDILDRIRTTSCQELRVRLLLDEAARVITQLREAKSTRVSSLFWLGVDAEGWQSW